ncbi:sugar ABC transporter ATP-binding protein [Peribacillus sp. SCS-26]|uniref:sugar ABC transporter ATP-binding protein n=1 Tax=Paraperibacillus marinus TaxID=3115295 RepID=UPI0039063601
MDKSPLLRLEEIWKKFDGNTVLKGVNLTVERGCIHALAGGNGAGKSTLMKIITGLYRPDSGIMEAAGKRVSFHTPAEAHRHGIYLVPQEPLIFSHMSVRENVIIGLKGSAGEWGRKAKELVSSLGWTMDLSRLAGTLSIAEQQLVELLRGLIRNSELLILDEPTSTLTPNEIESLFSTVKNLSQAGKGIIYITHRLTEILELADVVTILRDGRIAAHDRAAKFTYSRLAASLMPEGAVPAKGREKAVSMKKTAVLEICGLSGKRFQDISFSLSEGETLGIAGIVGAGRTELAEAVMGISAAYSGEIILEGEEITCLPVHMRLKKGMVYVPEDRHAHGIFAEASIAGNIASTTLGRMKGKLLLSRMETELAESYMGKLKVKAESARQPVWSLSGGNQQKTVLAKYLAAEPKVIILDEPTRGIDAGARLDIYEIIEDLKEAGHGVILISSDFEEIISICDRAMILHEGKLSKTLSGADLTLDNITKASYGVTGEEAE